MSNRLPRDQNRDALNRNPNYPSGGESWPAPDSDEKRERDLKALKKARVHVKPARPPRKS